MFHQTTTQRLILGVVAVAALALGSAEAPARVHVSFGYGGHHGYGHHGYRGHYGHRRSHYGHHRYRYGGHHGYRHSRYRYYGHGYSRSGTAHRRYSSPYAYHRSAPRVIVSPRTTVTTESRYPKAQSASTDTVETRRPITVADGWQLLNDGHYTQAFNAFAAAATADPESGEPKLGYALAAALRGDDSRAAYAIRRVLKFEPDVLDRPAPVADATIAKLIKRYEYQDTDDGRQMLKAMQRLQAATDAAKQDEASGEVSPSTHNDPY